MATAVEFIINTVLISPLSFISKKLCCISASQLDGSVYSSVHSSGRKHPSNSVHLKCKRIMDEDTYLVDNRSKSCNLLSKKIAVQAQQLETFENLNNLYD